MRVEIEISEEEARAVLAYRTLHGNAALCCRLAVRVSDALPRPIQVGDTVRWGQCTYPVLAIWKQWAWVGDDDAGPYSVPLKNLTLVSRGEL